MTPDKVRAMVSAMQAAGEDDDAIRSALTLAKSQEGPGLKPPMMDAEPGPFRGGYVMPPSKDEINKRRSDLNEANLRDAGGPQTVYTSPMQASAERSAADDEQFNKTAGAIGSGFTDSFALGMPGRILDLLPDKVAHHLGGTRAERDAYRQASPVGDVAGRTMGGGLSGVAGPEALIAKGIQSSLPAVAAGGEAAASPAAKFLTNTVPGRIVNNAVVGGGTGALSEGARAAAEGADAREAGKRALVGGAFGAGFSGAATVAGEVAGAANNAIRNSAGGRARQRLESRGANVGPLTSGEGGVFDNELAGLSPDDRGIGQASRRGASGVLQKLEGDYFKNVAMPHSANRSAIESSPEGTAARDVTPIYSDLVKVYQSERLTPPERSQVRSVLDRLDGHMGEQDGKLGIYMSENELNDFRGMLQDMSKTGSPANPTVAQSKMQKVAHATKEAVDQGPYAATNKAFHEGTDTYEGRRQLLDLPAKPSSSLDPAREAPEGGREPEVAKLANMMARDEQNTVTAGVRNADRLQQFSQQNPDFAPMLELPRLLEDKANLQFRLGAQSHGGLINRIKHEGVPAVALYGLAELFAHDPKLSAGIALGTHLLKTNAAPIAGRLLYSPAQAAVDAIPAGARALPSFLPQIEQEYADALQRLRQHAKQPQEQEQ